MEAMIFRLPTFGPSDNTFGTFRLTETVSQKLLVLATFLPQSGPTVGPSQKGSFGLMNSWINVRPHHMVPFYFSQSNFVTVSPPAPTHLQLHWLLHRHHHQPHCKPCEAYTCLKTASCEAGPGTTHMWILDICIRSLLIHDFSDRCVFHNSIFGLLKCYLYIEVRKYLKLSCQGSNHHPFNNLW